MSETTQSLRRKIDSAGELRSVVRTMKALAVSNIGQYEKSVRALADYNRTVELGLSVCFRDRAPVLPSVKNEARPEKPVVSAVVFGSDQGLVGQFNAVIAQFAMTALRSLPGKHQVWTVGERVRGRLSEAGLAAAGCFAVPNGVDAITTLVGDILLETGTDHGQGQISELHLFYNRPTARAAYAPVSQRLLPLDETWRSQLGRLTWPTGNLPEVAGGAAGTLRALIREYLFVSLFRACAESLASENASRLAAMQRADKNIGELLETLHGAFDELRQSAIDAELFDVIAGFDAMSQESG
jgi:F-type H+-transporting ATPase subunit gamma